MSNKEQVLQTNTRIITTREVSKEIFGGTKSEWAIGQAVRKGQIPHFRIGNRIFFEVNAIQVWAAAQMEKSMKPTIHEGSTRLLR